MLKTYTLRIAPPRRERSSWLRRAATATALLTVLTCSAALAQEPSFALHAFGEWGYGRTDGNRYLIGSENGNYSNSAFSLNLNGQANDQLSVVAQVGWTDDRAGSSIDLDYAFVSWAFADVAQMRLGKIKHPFGIYSEVQRVGTLRPFFTLPQAIYGPHGIVADGFAGAALSGLFAGSGSWGLQYDIYGGSIQTDIERVMEAAMGALDEMDDLTVQINVTNMVGGKLTVFTPLPGLAFAASGYTGEVEDDATVQAVRQKTFGGYLDYVHGNALLRAEAFRHLLDDIRMDGWYVEGAYTLFTNWQLAGRYESMVMDMGAMTMGMGGMGGMATGMTGMAMPMMASLMEHKEFAFGLNYWFNHDFAIKASYHNLNGNRFAHPLNVAGLTQAVTDGTLESGTHAVLVGAQFSY